MATNGLNGGVERALADQVHSQNASTLVERVEAHARELVDTTETGIEKADRATHSSTVAVLKHLEGVAEQAILAQCAVIRSLVMAAQDLDQVLLSDLARIKEVTRIALLNGERAAALAQSIKGAIGEMRAAHAEVVSVQTT